MRASKQVAARASAFFEQWVYRPVTPSSTCRSRGTARCSPHVKQTHSNADDVPPTFELMLYLDVVGGNGDTNASA